MFIVDDALLFPFKALMGVFQEIHQAARQELEAESAAIRHELSQLYLALEAGNLTDLAFDERERTLLDRLDAIDNRDATDEDDEDADDDDEDDDDDDEEFDEDDDDEETD